jgi:Ran GTPase-activating protein (RanGAP) involved in mRNA processing and transport
MQEAQRMSPFSLNFLRNHPLLPRLCLYVYRMNLAGLETLTLLLSETSKITELEINGSYGGRTNMGLWHVLRALALRPTLTKLEIHGVHLGLDEVRLLRTALRNTSSLQSLNLTSNDIGSTGLAELAPALYRNTSIKALDLSRNDLNDMDSARC